MVLYNDYTLRYIKKITIVRLNLEMEQILIFYNFFSVVLCEKLCDSLRLNDCNSIVLNAENRKEKKRKEPQSRSKKLKI